MLSEKLNGNTGFYFEDLDQLLDHSPAPKQKDLFPPIEDFIYSTLFQRKMASKRSLSFISNQVEISQSLGYSAGLEDTLVKQVKSYFNHKFDEFVG